jgi:ketosteroid isomerase-like protein
MNSVASLTRKRRKPSAEREVALLVEQIADAIRARDVEAVLRNYAPDVLAYDLLPPLQYKGAVALRQRLAAWLGSFTGTIAFEMRDLTIAAGSNVAFCHSLNGVNGTSADGTQVDMWWRATMGFRRIGGIWLVTHAHSSEPFDMPSGNALTELRP